MFNRIVRGSLFAVALIALAAVFLPLDNLPASAPQGPGLEMIVVPSFASPVHNLDAAADDVPAPSGVLLIARERQDQALEVSRFNPDRHPNLLHAAEYYLQAGRLQSYGVPVDNLTSWMSGALPWPFQEPFQAKASPAENFAAAGALLAAEIDRLDGSRQSTVAAPKRQ